MTTTAAIHDLTGAYVLDALSTDERRAFELHLAECAACTEEVRELREIAAQLAAAVAVRSPAPALRDRVLIGIRDIRQCPADRVPRAATHARSRRGTRVAVAAVAAVIVGGTAVGGGQHRQSEPASSAVRTAPDATVNRAAADVGGSATAVVSRGERKVAVFTSGLPALDGAHSYQVWLIGSGGPQSAGLLHDGSTGERRALVVDIPADVDHIAITVEPAGGSPRPTTPGIVRIDLA